MKTSKRKGSGDKGDPPKRPKTEQDENTDEPKTTKAKPNRPKKYTKGDFGYFLEKLIELDQEISTMKENENTTHKEMEEKLKERRRTWKQFQRKNIQDQAEQYYIDNPDDFRYPDPPRRKTSEKSRSSKSTPTKGEKSKPKKKTKKRPRQKSTTPEPSENSENPIYSSTDNEESEQKEIDEPEQKEPDKTPPKRTIKPSRLAVPIPKPKSKPKSDEEEDKPKKKKKKTKKRKRKTKSNKDKPKKPKINPLDTSVEIDDEEDRRRFEAEKKAHDIKNRISCDKKIEKLGQAGTSKQGFIPKSIDKPKAAPTFMKPQHDKDLEAVKQDEFKQAVKKGKPKPKKTIEIKIVKNMEELAEMGESNLKEIGIIQTDGKKLTQAELTEIELKVSIETFVNDILDYLDKGLEEYQKMINEIYPIEPFLAEKSLLSEIAENQEQDESSSELEILSETRPIKKEVDDWVEGQKGQKYDEADEEITDQHNTTMTTVFSEEDEEAEEPKQDEKLHNLIKTNFKHLTPVPNLGFQFDFKLVPTLQSGTKYLVTDHRTLETAKVTMAWVTDLELKLNKSESKIEVLEKEILHRKKAKNERKIVTDMERAAFQELIRSKDETIKSMQAQIDGHTCKQRGVEHFHEMRPGLTIRAITYLEECPDSDSPSTSPKRTEPRK